MSIFLQIPDVTGESTIEGFIGQFLAGSLFWGGASILGQGIKPTYKTSPTGVSVSKRGTINSPTLMLLMVNQKKLGSVVITISKELAGKSLPVHVYTLSNAYLMSMSQSTNNQNPDEDLTFNYSRVTYKQIYYDNAGIKTGDETHYWDVATSKGA